LRESVSSKKWASALFLLFNSKKNVI
jgi:hypothetical protein